MILKRQLLKLTTENTSNFFKQINGCPMSGALSVIFSDNYMIKTKREVCKSTKTKVLTVTTTIKLTMTIFMTITI